MLQARYLSPLVAAAALAAAPAWSQAIIAPAAPDVIIVTPAPPPLPQEAIPAAREGYVWSPGYWNYDGARHVWVDGHFVESPPGMAYGAATWEGRAGNYGRRGMGERSRPNPLGNSVANPLEPSPGQ
jgi:hypothetical protein